MAGEVATRPDNVPEKFWDAEKGEVNQEALLASYAELEKTNSTPKEEASEEDASTAEEAVENAGLNMDELRTEFADKGELSAESLAKLKAVGITEDMVDQYVAGQAAQAEQIQKQLLDPVGGPEAYDEMTSWASDNLNDAEIDAFNEALESGNMGTIKMALENLKTKYTDANGAEPQRQLNGKPSANSMSVYESTADLMKDMQNPEYANNPAFRKKVEEKLGRSSIL